MIGIIGGGLAAAKLVEGYRESGGADEITIWSQDPHGPYHRPPLSKKVLRGDAKPEDGLVHPYDWYAENGVDLRLGETVASLDQLTTETIVIATGARPRELKGTIGLRTFNSAIELRKRAEAARTAVVIGGGFIGCEVTASLTLVGVEVIQIVRDPMVFAPLKAPPLSEALHDLFRAHGVDLRLEESEVPEGADLMVAGIGRRPERRARDRRGPRDRGGRRRRRRRAVPDLPARCLRDRRRRRVLRPALSSASPHRALVELRVPRHHARQDPRRRGRALRHRLVVLLRAVRAGLQGLRRHARPRRHRFGRGLP